MDQPTFVGLVADAVTHLYDHPYLQTHVLGRLLVPEPTADLRGRALQRVMLDAIDALKPSTEAAGTTYAWRTYRYLFLRYVQVLPPRDVARELAISERQGRRTFREAIDALASVLWDRYHERISQLIDPLVDDYSGATSASAEATPPRVSPGADPRLASVQGNSVLDQEVRHLAATGRGRTTELDEVVDGLRLIVGALAQRHGCSWSVQLEPNLPTVDADRVVVRQILLNVCTLAFECGQGHLRLWADERAGFVRITLEFSPTSAAGLVALERDTTPTARRPGSRLSVSRRLVEAEGGRIETRRTEGGVMTITVQLRAARPSTVLVVDDNPDVVALFSRYLETAGCRVIVARTGAEGFRLAQQARPAAITLDVMMASQDGWETLQLLKNDSSTHDIPVLICSVLREEELAMVLGAAELLPKPVTRSDLLSALARCGLHAAVEGHRSSF